MRIILFFILSAVFAQDIYVDGNANYEVDNYAKFDRFTKHGVGITIISHQKMK